MKTFFEKRDMWKEQVEKEVFKNPDIIMNWTNGSNLKILPNGDVVISYPFELVDPITFEGAVISIEDFFEGENKKQ